MECSEAIKKVGLLDKKGKFAKHEIFAKKMFSQKRSQVKNHRNLEFIRNNFFRLNTKKKYFTEKRSNFLLLVVVINSKRSKKYKEEGLSAKVSY